MSQRPLSVVSPSLDRASFPSRLAIVGIGSLVLAVAAHVAVPFWPVPITLQTLAVLLIGVVVGPRLGVGTVVAYVVEGLVGLPVFSHGGGLAALTGPTFGYIVGFLPAVLLVGIAARRTWLLGVGGTLAVFIAADVLVFAFGLAWLAVSFGWSKAIAVGLTPFLIGEAIKIALATAATRFWVGAAGH